MSGEDKMGCFAAIMAIVCFIGGLLTGFYASDVDWEREAVKHGAAEYVLEPATGKTTWRWKEKAEDVENK